MDIGIIIFLCVAGFTASFVDSIAGGGGIISLPAVLAAGVPPHMALGTNKFASTCASFTSTITFARSKKIYFPLVKYQIPCTLIGSALGVQSVLSISQRFLQLMIVVLVFAVTLYTIFKKDFGVKDNFEGLTKKSIIYGCLFAFALGFYDGFFGPGTGSFLVFLFITLYGFDFTIAAGNSRILNFVSNVTSLVLFALHGKIAYLIGLPMALSMIFGARMGSKVAISNGAKIIKPIFITIAGALIIKLLYQAVFSS